MPCLYLALRAAELTHPSLPAPPPSYYNNERLRGDVVPEQQKGGYMTITPGELDIGKKLSAMSGLGDDVHDSYLELAPVCAGRQTLPTFGCTLMASHVPSPLLSAHLQNKKGASSAARGGAGSGAGAASAAGTSEYLGIGPN